MNTFSKDIVVKIFYYVDFCEFQCVNLSLFGVREMRTNRETEKQQIEMRNTHFVCKTHYAEMQKSFETLSSELSGSEPPKSR